MKCPNLHCLQSLSGDPEACPNCGLPLPGAVLGERFRLERVESASATAVRFGGHEGTSAVRVRVYLAGGGKGQRVGVISREVAEVRDLGSGGMPRVLGAAVAGPLPWVATDGGDHLALDREMLRQQRPYSEKEVVAVLEGVARTLAPLHAKGIAHRGIRPDQLFRRDGDAHVGLGLPNWGADLEDR
ncbi:MAG: hypothetical protein FJZ01_12100, partial [Candidatus Sericytochromatia bacterium]|nr:hypothetical protein [Candidatus Tanganyikabacteria bacterium]